MFEKARAMAGDQPSLLAAMGQFYALSGNEQRARELLTQFETLSKTRYVSMTCFAIVHIGLREFSRALDYLEASCERREAPIAGLKVHPLFDALRGEPRFRAMLKRVRLG